MDRKLSEEFLSELTKSERDFILSWYKLLESEEFKQKINDLKK